MSAVISALKPKENYGLKYCPKSQNDSWELLGDEPQNAKYIKNALGSLYDDVCKLQGILASKKMLSDALSRLMAIKRASNGEAMVTILINEISEDFQGQISALALLISYQELKEINSPWYPSYHEIAQIFKKNIKNTTNINQTMEIEND